MTSDVVRAVVPAQPGDPVGRVFDNDGEHAAEHHRCLAAVFDAFSTERLAATGVTDGWRCLEVGAGGGSVAEWLAQHVTPAGSVLATDVKPKHITPAPRLAVLRHDIVRDRLPADRFDLVHARFVLLHLPQRLAVLDRLVRAMRPGGWLQLDEPDLDYAPPLLVPDPAAGELFRAFVAARSAVFAMAGADVAWGRTAAQAMRDAGLVDVDPVPRVEVWRAGSPWARLLAHETVQLRHPLVAAGLADDDLAAVRRLLADPSLRAVSCPIYSVHGRRPR